MSGPSQYSINLSPIPQGNSEWDCVLDDTFFARQELFGVTGGRVCVHAKVLRTGDLYEFRFSLVGQVVVICDRCLTEAEVEVNSEELLVVKLGDKFDDSEVNEIVVPRTDARLSLAQVLYEWVVLSLPLSKGHAEGACPEEMERLLAEHSPQSVDEQSVDPRWAALSDLVKEK